jgi:ABC-2 type transport system ATP-binding protein
MPKMTNSANAASSLIDAQNLGKSFGGTVAVDGMTFQVKAGELVGFMGPNGAGKSTTMRLLAGFMPPDTGRVLINGVDMQAHPRQAQAFLGYLPEQGGVFGHLTAREYLTFLAESHQVADVMGAVAVSSEMTRCRYLLDCPMETLSKGQRQRVFFAGAILHDPPVLILDEPTDGLDPNQKHEMRLVLKELARHKAVLLSTHILEEAEAVCTRVLIVSHGAIVADQTPAELAKQGRGDIQVAFRVLTTMQARVGSTRS